MIKCSFCEQPLVCAACGRPFVPSSPESYAALSQPDMALFCPACEAQLVCKACGFVYGEEEEGLAE